MKKHFFLISLYAFFGCLSLPIAWSQTNVEPSVGSLSVIENHYGLKNTYSTVLIKANARYKDDNQTQNVSAEIRIKKGESILVSIRFLGITMAKAFITPDKVRYYEKLNSKYFEGNYSILSQWLGTDLDFTKVQNLFLGETFEDLKTGTFVQSTEDNTIKFQKEEENKSNKLFYLKSDSLFLFKEIVMQLEQQRQFQVVYPAFKEYSETNLPTSIEIEAKHEQSTTSIEIAYNTVTFNEELTFPYNVPDGYEQIIIN